MHRRPRALVALAVGVAVGAGLVACGDGGGDEASELDRRVARVVADGAAQVQARLESYGADVAVADLEAVEAGDVRCPRVREPEPGDRATCTLAVAGTDVLVDVEFGDGGAVTVIGVEVRVTAADDDVEGAVAALLAARLGGPAPAVTCPGAPPEPEPGDRVRCRVDLDAGGVGPTEVALHVDDHGALVLDTGVFDRADVEAFLAGELSGTAEGDVEVRCGEADVLVAPVGERLTCEAERLDDGAPFDVLVRVEGADGELSYEVRPR